MLLSHPVKNNYIFAETPKLSYSYISENEQLGGLSDISNAMPCTFNHAMRRPAIMQFCNSAILQFCKSATYNYHCFDFPNPKLQLDRFFYFEINEIFVKLYFRNFKIVKNQS